jgi:FixJ family two-component response regulator
MRQHAPPLVAIVDDNASMRTAVTSLVRSLGFDAEPFPSATAFLRYPDVARVACVVVDVCMPRTSGFALQLEMLASRPGMPLILMSARSDRQTRLVAMRRGAVAFLRKPFSARLLQAALRRALAGVAAQEPHRDLSPHPPG